MNKTIKIAFTLLFLFTTAQFFCAEGFVIREEYNTFDEQPFPMCKNKNADGKYYFYIYCIEKAPDDYEKSLGTTVYYDTTFIHLESGSIGNVFPEACLDDINEAFLSDNFSTMEFNGESIIVVSKPGRSLSFQEEKDFIYDSLKKHYAGFKDMKKKGFSKKVWKEVQNYDQMYEVFYKYICDNHFSLSHGSKLLFKRKQVFDEGSVKSTDPDYTMFSITTSNTFYIRCNNCDKTWDKYANLPALAGNASLKAYIVLDFRSNNGGSNYEQNLFFKNLARLKYKGTIFVLQDNWSYSSGEVWEIAYEFKNKLNLKLVGTHSGGMQSYGNCENFTKGNVTVYLPTKKFASHLPPNFLGEGIGYEPDIWALTKNMKTTLENEGCSLDEIEFN